MSKTYSFKRTQVLPVSIGEAWSFFSDPANLQAITPATMNFRVISQFSGGEIYPGQVIEYKVSPVWNIPVYWMTEITHVENHKFFVDEQRFGPYSFWHHQHHFNEQAGGVEMTDMVHYRVPFGIFGDLANTLFVSRKLKEIFDYRYEVLKTRFIERKPNQL